MRRDRGFTLIELLVSIAVFGVILLVVLDFLTGSQRTAAQQQARTAALTDARSAASHLAEIVSQASYVYPAGLRIKVSLGTANRTIETGSQALALLLQDDRTPCDSSATCRYTGVLIFVDDRAGYPSQVPANPRIAPGVLVEGRTARPMPWAPDSLPELDWRISGGPLLTGIQAESIVAAGTDLMAPGSGFAGSAGSDDTVFSGGIVKPGSLPSLNQPDALINRLAFGLSVQPGIGSLSPIQLQGSASARNVPRSH